jgi:TRAP-type uncharacterized transport system substrate-binding protein
MVKPTHFSGASIILCGNRRKRGHYAVAVGRTVVDYMKEAYGFSEAIIPKGRLKGVEEDLLTLDYGGWLLACREDLPEEVAYLLAKVCADQRDAVAAPYKDQPKHLQSFEIPITTQHLCTKCVIPLHRGAEKYYREIGCRQNLSMRRCCPDHQENDPRKTTRQRLSRTGC